MQLIRKVWARKVEKGKDQLLVTIPVDNDKGIAEGSYVVIMKVGVTYESRD